MIKHLTEEHKKKIADAIRLQHPNRDNYAMNGKKHKEETKLKMSLASKGKPKSKEHVKNWKESIKKLRAEGKFPQWNKGITNRKNKYISMNKISHKVYTSQPDNFYRVPVGIVIHHLDLDETNNNPTNLMMLDRNTHAKLHGTIWKMIRQ
jgi:hypothetical protein